MLLAMLRTMGGGRMSKRPTLRRPDSIRSVRRTSVRPVVRKPPPNRRERSALRDGARPFISRVIVRDLYGRLDYNLEFPSAITRSKQSAIVFGENGTGKSTILRLVYSAICPNPKQGLRTYLSVTPFSLFEIHLASGHR